MSNDSFNSVETYRIYKMLCELAEMAEHASITGFLKQGKPSAIQRYNAILAHLERIEKIPPGLFLPLSDEASFDELNIEGKLLASYIKDDAKQARKEDTARDIEDLMNEVRQLSRLKETIADAMPELLERKAGVKEEVLGELQGLRELRASLSDMMPELIRGPRSAPPTPPAPPAPPTPPPAGSPTERADLERQLAQLQKRLAELEASKANQDASKQER